MMRHGDPCKTRMKVHWDGHWWRVFEIAQPGQDVSRHPDVRFASWKFAMALANDAARRDRQLCLKQHATKRSEVGLL